MKDSSVQSFITLKNAELYALEDLLRPQSYALHRSTLMQPDKWVQRLAEVKLLHDYASHLSEFPFVLGTSVANIRYQHPTHLPQQSDPDAVASPVSRPMSHTSVV